MRFQISDFRFQIADSRSDFSLQLLVQIDGFVTPKVSVYHQDQRPQFIYNLT